MPGSTTTIGPTVTTPTTTGGTTTITSGSSAAETTLSVTDSSSAATHSSAGPSTVVAVTSSTAANPCLTITCQNNGVCETDQSEQASCTCDEFTTGDHCELYVPFYTAWGNYSACDQTCGTTAVRTRERTCTDNSGANRDVVECKDDGSSMETEACTGLPECTCTTHPCVDANGVHTNRHCNPSGGNGHICYEKYDTVNYQCLIQCRCADGYVSNAANNSCIDANQCLEPSIECYNSLTTTPKTGVSACNDLTGDYSCTCDSGYQHAGLSNKICEDIDECAAGTHNCDDSSRADCVNTAGSFTCSCKSGFAGNGFAGTCLYQRFPVPSFTVAATKVTGDFSDLIFIDEGGFRSSVDDTSVINSFYITKSGLIIFTSYQRGDSFTGRVMAQPKDYSLAKLSGGGLKNIDHKIVHVAAPYWSDSAVASGGGIYIQEFSSISTEIETKLEEYGVESDIFGSSMTGTDFAVTAITWDRMTPNTNPRDESQLNSFQALVIRNNEKTILKVLYFYQDRGMTWDLTLWGSTEQQLYPTRVGVAFAGTNSNSAHAMKYTASGALLADSASETAWLQVQNQIARIDMYDQAGTSQSTVQQNGFQVYTITDSSSYYDPPSMLCRQALSTIIPHYSLHGFADQCGSTLAQIESVLQSNWVKVDGVPTEYTCYRHRVPSNSSSTLVSPTCCYTGGSLVPANAMQQLSGANLIWISPGESVTVDGFENCCKSSFISSGLTTQRLCNSFLDKRPACTSSQFNQSVIAQVRGDPHFTTLDGLTYTFNGHGEFILVQYNDFQVQGRTERVIDVNETTQDATVFTSFVATAGNGPVVEIRLNSTGDGVEVVANGDVDNTIDWTTLNTITTNDMSALIFMDSTTTPPTYSMSFDNSVVVKIKVAFSTMTISMILPSTFSDNTTGLMGNNNGNMEDDFIFSNGTVLAAGSNSTEQEIYPFGLSWMTDSSTSLFTYSTGNWSSYNFPDFIPVFFNSDLSAMFDNDAALVETAERLCNGDVTPDTNPTARRECYFDFKVTANQDAAAATVAEAAALAENQAALSNFAPTITNSNSTLLQVTVGESQPTLLTVTATDQNNDALTFELQNPPTGLSIDAGTGVLSWTNPQFATNGSVTVVVPDGTASALFQPPVALCNCQNGGTCMFDQTNPKSWYVVQCDCPIAWEGDFCTEDIDGCAENPCFSGCTDIPAALVVNAQFLCDLCPAGLDGDGRSCYDVNECLDTPCNQTCTNTAGSYLCSCVEGYALGADGRSCTDLDECRLATDNCDTNAVCENTYGGFTCTCNDGYSGVGTTCIDVNECQTTANCPANSNCVNNEGSFSCVCVFGYTMNLGVCENIDECAFSYDCDHICVDGIGAYSCACNSNFDLDENDRVSCIPQTACSDAEKLQLCDGGNNRSTCAKDSAGEVLCYCPAGYTLSNNLCVDINECNTGNNICSAATSTCVNTEPRYECNCKTGFNLNEDGLTCSDVDECALGSDTCDQVCTNTAGGYSCSCISGYVRNEAGTACVDVNECSSSVTNDCDGTNGACVNTNLNSTFPLGYECTCNTGYILSADLTTCIDLNECTTSERGGCEQGCSNTIGGYSCYCGSGYSLNAADGRTCQDNDECASMSTHNCYSEDVCTNTVGGYTCLCPTDFVLMSDGYTCRSLLSCAADNQCTYACAVLNGIDTCTCARGRALTSDNITCVDIDECDTGAHVCSSENNVECFNLDPGHQCQCISSEYTQVEAAKCVDVDECSAGTYSCPANSQCKNTVPGYTCTCNSGYEDDLAGSCINIDECLIATDQCHTTLGVCADTDGAYTCSCIDGYEGDGVTCNDINECVTDTLSCDSRTDRSICTNTVGSHTCSCFTGYIMSSTNSGYLCNDINECSDKETYGVNCSQLCVNINGGFLCECQTGYRLAVDGYSCEPLVVCDNPSVCDHGCVKLSGVDMCTCDPGYELAANNRTCNDVDECTRDTPCDASRGVCSNNLGLYECTCLEDYTLGSNNECNDRNGGLSDWSPWSSCTELCGTSGTQIRERNCSNPTPEGNGALCSGDTSETQSCNIFLCEEQLESGVAVNIANLTISDFNRAQTALKSTILLAVNEHCSTNETTAQACCGGTSNAFSSTTGLDFLSSTNEIDIEAFTTTNGLKLVVLLKYDDGNDLCASGTAVTASRRRRALVTIEQAVLLEALDDPALLAIIKEVIFNVTGTIVTMESITVANQQTVSTTSTAAMVSTAKPTGGVQAWVIAVAVVAALVAVSIIVIIVVILLKRPRKVAAGDEPPTEQE